MPVLIFIAYLMQFGTEFCFFYRFRWSNRTQSCSSILDQLVADQKVCGYYIYEFILM